MLLNKLNVLDKGYIALVSSSNDGLRCREIVEEFFAAQFHSALVNIATATIYFKCPLFVQLNLSKFNFTIIGIPPKEDKQEAYVPDETDVRTSDREINTTIADDIYRTTEALLINPLAYQKDGCDRFTSQVLTPISLYTEILVHGSLEQWIKYISQESLPAQIVAYQVVIENIIRAEWKELDTIKAYTINRYK